MRTQWTIGLAASIVVAVVACEREIAPGGFLNEMRQALGGVGVVKVPHGRSESLTSAESVAGAVVEIRSSSLPGGTCSGTLVSRDRVLTTAACAYVETSPGNFAPIEDLEIVLHQEPDVSYSVRASFQVQSSKLTVLVLSAEVPESTVELVPPLFAGPIQDALGSRLDPDSGVLVGHGPTCVGCSDHGVRRMGRINQPVQVCSGLDPSCGIPETDNLLVAHLDANMGAQLYSFGDEGSPLFLRDSNVGGYVLVGILRQRATVGTNPVAWDFLGKFAASDTSPDHWTFLQSLWLVGDQVQFVPSGQTPPPGSEPLLGWDEDGDRVLDASDNCPPEHCIDLGLPITDCFNPDQLDSNFNGIGDVCDELDLGSGGSGGDGGSGGTGGTGGNDDDQGSHCKDVDEADWLEVLPPGATFTWNCTNPFDFVLLKDDRIRLMNALVTPPPDGGIDPGLLLFVGHGNSNMHAEMSLRSPTEKDTCDPVPILRMPGVRWRISLRNGVIHERSNSLRFEADPWIGSRTFRSACQKVDFLFCDCTENGKAVDFDTCFEKGPCTLPWSLNNNWKGGLSVAARTKKFHFKEGIQMPLERFTWFWAADANSGKIPASLHPDNIWSARGLLASVVNYDMSQSHRDRYYGGRLRFTVVPVELGPGSPFPGVIVAPDPDLGWNRLLDLVKGENAFGFLLPGYWERKVHPLYGGHSMGMPLFVEPTKGKVVAWLDGAEAVDVEDGLSDALRAAIKGPESPRLIHPVEPIGFLDYFELPITSVAIDRGGPQPYRARIVGSSLGSWKVDFRSDFAELRVPFHANARYAYSALKQVLFAAGGGVVPNGRLARFDFLQGTMTTVHLGISTEEVVALAYDVWSESLFLLDSNGPTIRLLRHDLRSGTTKILWTVPSRNRIDSHLTITEFGDIVLTVEKEGAYRVCLLDPETGGHRATREGVGTLASGPVMGRDMLYLPVVDDDGMKHLPLHRMEFAEGAPCTEWY